MKSMTTRRQFLANAGWAGIGFLLFSFATTTLGRTGPQSAPLAAKPSGSAPVMRQGWLLSQDDR